MPDALGALQRIDLVDLLAGRDRLVRALRLAHVAVDAFVGDDQSHTNLSLPMDPESRGEARRWSRMTRNFASLAAELLDFHFQAFADERRHELGRVAAEDRYLANDGRRNEHELLARREKDRFDIGVHAAVHPGELELVFEVGDRA